MNALNNITVTKISDLITVNSIKGKKEKMINRSCYGLSFCIEGQITYTHKNKKVVSTKNCAVILPKGQSYTIERNKKGLFPVINFDCLEPLCDTVIGIPIQNPEKYIADFEHMKQLLLFDGNLLKAMSIFYNILHHLSQTETVGPLSPAVKYIENNFSNPDLKNASLALKCGISEVYLRKLFLKHFNITPKQFIIDVRINKAKQLLTDGGLKISAIAEKCGFSNQYHFSRLFKEKTGLVPMEYMKQNMIHKI